MDFLTYLKFIIKWTLNENKRKEKIKGVRHSRMLSILKCRFVEKQKFLPKTMVRIAISTQGTPKQAFRL
jgi:hypothetical protein